MGESSIIQKNSSSGLQLLNTHTTHPAHRYLKQLDNLNKSEDIINLTCHHYYLPQHILSPRRIVPPQT